MGGRRLADLHDQVGKPLTWTTHHHGRMTMSNKTYNTPQLTPKGSVVELTKTIVSGNGDPEGALKFEPTGSLGFLL